MVGHRHNRRHLAGGVALWVVLALSVSAQTARAQSATDGTAVNAGSVSATGASDAAALPGATAQPTAKKIFQTPQTIRVLDKAQIDAAGPVAGAAQIISYAPGANVIGYGNTGATKYSITLNGINQGWTGYGSAYSGVGSLGITFDGIPIADPATDLWQSPTLPQASLIQNSSVTYGPGDPVDRWYSNVGGAVEFTPLQPKAKAGGEVSTTYGSNGQKNLSFNLQTGTWHGWSTVLGGGMGEGDSFRQSPDGFTSGSHNYAAFLKTVKTFSAGSFEFGGYYAHSGGYRPPVIPVTANAGITMTGAPGGQLYSQQTSGFYSSLPFASYNKNDSNEMALAYAREHFNLDDTTTLHNQTWFMRIARMHSRLADVYNLGPQQYEFNSPHTNTIGDKLWVTEKLPFNTVDIGGYYIHTLFNTRNNFFNPALGGNRTTANIGGKVRSGDFNQDDMALFVQDDISPIKMLHIIPGIRFVSYQVDYANMSAQDFNLAPGTILSSQCPVTGATTAGNAKDQGASCPNHQSRGAIEPSISISLTPLPWLTLYGGYQETTRAPQLGGGGGLFQSVDPRSYHLALAQYYQAGFKVNVEHMSVLNNFLFGASYYHLRYAKQEIDTALANGNTIAANGTSVYDGVNVFFDDNPIYKLHVFGNLNVEEAKYTSYVTGGVSYNGAPVPYVPSTILNAGAYFKTLTHGVLVEPRAWVQFTGAQHIFDNTVAAPSNQTMAAFGTLNMSVKATVPLHLPHGIGTRFLDLKLTALNVLDRQYNQFTYISSGGYFGTPTGGYQLAYPGAPMSIYGTVGVRF